MLRSTNTVYRPEDRLPVTSDGVMSQRLTLRRLEDIADENLDRLTEEEAALAVKQEDLLNDYTKRVEQHRAACTYCSVYDDGSCITLKQMAAHYQAAHKKLLEDMAENLRDQCHWRLLVGCRRCATASADCASFPCEKRDRLQGSALGRLRKINAELNPGLPRPEEDLELTVKDPTQSIPPWRRIPTHHASSQWT